MTNSIVSHAFDPTAAPSTNHAIEVVLDRRYLDRNRASRISRTTRGMAAALPFIDCFAAAHTLEGLAAIEGELARL